MQQKEVLFIGLGRMGSPTAGYLNKDPKLSVSVWSRNPDKAKQWGQMHSGRVISKLDERVLFFDYVFLCVGGDDDVDEILFGSSGIDQFLKKGSIVIDHTTTSVASAKASYKRLKKKGVAFLDAPLSGGEAGAKNGSLSVMVGGDENAFKNAEPLFSNYTKTLVYIGTNGSGQLTKMVNQICITGVLEGLSQGILFAEAEKLDLNRVFTAITNGAATSWQMENRALTMHKREFGFGFAINWMAKDLQYCLKQATENGTKMPSVQRVYDKYSSLIEAGEGGSDSSALILAKENE